MALGDDLADVIDRDNEQIAKLQERCFLYANGLVVLVLLLIMIGVALAAAQSREVPSADPTEWSSFTSEKGNRWMVKDSSIIAILDVSNQKDAEALGRKTIIHLPGLTIGSKMSLEEISAEVKNLRATNRD